MRGVEDQEAYTNSVMRILKEAGLNKNRWEVAMGRRSVRRQEVQGVRSESIKTSNSFSGLDLKKGQKSPFVSMSRAHMSM